MVRKVAVCPEWGTKRGARPRFLLTLVFVGLSSFVTAQEAPSIFREQATVVAIEVPVVVLLDGAPVRGLSAEDFVLEQDGQVQKILGFEAIDLSPTTQREGTPVPEPFSLAGRRYFLLAFDLSHTRPVFARKAVEAARDLVETGLHPSDLVGVALYSATAGARLLHPFSSDPTRLESALLAVEAVASRDKEVVDRARASLESGEDRSSEELRQFLLEIRSFLLKQGVGLESTVGLAGEALAAGVGGGRGGALMAEILAEMEADYQKIVVNVVRDRSLDLLMTLGDLAAALEGVRGQKHFVLFSEGIDETVFENPFDTRGSKQLAQVLQAFRRSGWIVQSIDVGNQRSQARGMSLLANETGGTHYRNFNSLSIAMGKLLDKTSVSYVLSFQPDDLEYDGSYHSIEVRLKDSRRARLEHRDGYFEPKAAMGGKDEWVAIENRVGTYKDGGPVGISLLAATFPGSGPSVRVSLLAEIDGGGLLANQIASPLDLQLEMYLLDDSGGAVALASRRVPVDPIEHGGLLRSGGIKLMGDFLLAPGDHVLRVVVRDMATRYRSVRTLAIQVPDFPNGESLVFRPFFPEVTNGWLPVRLASDLPDETADFPFRFGDRKFLPRIEVDLERGASVPVCVMVSALDIEEKPLALALLHADGSPIAGEPIRITSGVEKDANGVSRVMAVLSTEGLAPGEYILRASHPGDAPGNKLLSERPLRVH